jgi:hypothetical protein
MRLFVVLGLLALSATTAAAQDRRLSVRVEDPSGATIPNAQIIVLAGSDVVTEQNADGRGLATIAVGARQQLTLIVTAEGFATTEVDVTIPPRVTTHPVTVALPIATIAADVMVSATQEETGGSTETLSQAEIDQLPDDPDELQRVLEEIAGPGATIRVDGFTGGRLPTRDQIARIVVRRDAYSSEFHQVGQGRVEIATRPGVDRWRGNAGLNVRPSGLSATNAVARGSKSGTLVRFNAFTAGPLVKNRISLSAEAEGSSSEDTRGISALTPSGPVIATLQQPFDGRELSVRTEGLLTQKTMFRASYSRDNSERGNQGLSELDLPERGYVREDVEDNLRFSLEGGQRRPFHIRLQLDRSRGTATPDTIAPAIVVQSAFRAGGATTAGIDRERNFTGDTMFTVKARPYTLRAGSLVTFDRNELGQLRNTLGTFTFTDLDAYSAGRPSTYTQRVGARTLAFSVGQAATFVQADFVRARWNIGTGVRYEWQTGIDHRGAIAPRIGVTRSFRRNTTNFRSGYGWFYGWMPARIEEETRRLAAGSNEEEVVIRDPGFPDPFGAGTPTTRRDPPTQLMLAENAELPRWQRVSVGLDHQIRQGLRLNGDVFYEHTGNDFRSLDLNAPVDGVRPDAAFGRVLLVQSIGRATRAGANIDLSYSPRQGVFSNIRYGYSRTRNDGDDALTPPPLGTYVGEYGPARGEFPHRLNWNLGAPIQRWGVFFSINGRLQSGQPYNITTGRDDNGDAIFNDRPAGTRRNSLRGALTTQTDLRVSWTVPSPRPNGAVTFQRGPGGQGGGGPRGPGRPGGPGGRNNQVQRRFEMYLFVTNAFNRVNRSSYVGVLNSPLFGQSTSAQAPRRMELASPTSSQCTRSLLTACPQCMFPHLVP